MPEVGDRYRRNRHRCWDSNNSNNVPTPRILTAPSRDPNTRWGSNLSTQRRERTVIWASCLQKVQALRRGGYWNASAEESGGHRDYPVLEFVGGDEDGGALRDSKGNGVQLLTSVGSGEVAQETEDELNSQLDLLLSLTYPNSCISPQDAGFMVAALGEAVPPSSAKVRARVARLFILLCAKQQQKVAFLPWQLDIVLLFFVNSATLETSPSSPQQQQQQQQEQQMQHEREVPQGRRECVRALAQLVYDNGERLGSRFEIILPPLLGLAAPSAADLQTRHAALDALANLCLKNWAALTPLQRETVCSCLTKNFEAHWRACAAFSSLSATAECKVLASASRGLAFAVTKGGVSSSGLEVHLARIVHALNHLVQPASEAERETAAASSAGRKGSNSASRSRSRGRVSDGLEDGTGLSPTRVSAAAGAVVTPAASSFLSDPRARVRLQALALLEALAVKDAKRLYPHWPLFFAICDQAVGGVGEVGRFSEPSPVLPAGLVLIMEEDHAPQVRAAAAAAAASLVKSAPLRKWMSPSDSTSAAGASGSGSGGWGIGQRAESMMLRLHRSLVQCLSREESPAVLMKLCACSGALMVGLPYAVASASSGNACREYGGSSATFGGNAGSLDGSLRCLLSGLARLITDMSAEPSARVSASQALTAAFSTKEPIAAVDGFLQTFHCDPVPESGPTALSPLGAASAERFGRRPASSFPLRAGSADDRGNRFASDGRRGAAEPTAGLTSARSRRGIEGSNGRFGRRGRGGFSDRIHLSPASLPVDDGGMALLSNGVSSSSRSRSAGGTPSSRAGNDAGEPFVHRLIGLAGSPGQLRADALGLLARVARYYPARLSRGSGGGGGARREETWEKASALLLRGFADPDQNVRLHALKVVEALLLARSERAASVADAGTASLPAPGFKNEESIFCVDGKVGEEGDIGLNVGSRGNGGRGGNGLWEDLIQKHLQRALEDPYHGVRAVACSCHGCLLNSDWDGFSERERARCLDRLLAATRDGTAGVNVLACRVLAGLMMMAGREGSAAWCRDRTFLERCSERLQEMLQASKDTVRAQAMLAVGNLSWSLHRTRSRPSTGGHPCDRCTNTMSGDRPPPGEELISRPRLRSLCDAAIYLVATEPDHAAGSAARALGYLAWALDPVVCRCHAVLPGPCSESCEDRRLQDEAVSTLASRLGHESEGTGFAADVACERGGRKLDGAVAKCRWNCCIALGVVLSAPGVRERVSGAPWAPVLMRTLCTAMEADEHLKVRMHAALTLKAIPVAGKYDDNLPTVFAGSLRALKACQQGVVVPDPAQMRYTAALEAALRALALRLLLHLVLCDGNTIKRCAAGSDFLQRGGLEGGEGSPVGSSNEGSKRVAILREYADDLLELVASREADTALSSADLLPYFRAIPEEFHTALGVTESKGASVDIALETPEVAAMLSQAVLCAASEVLLFMFSGTGGRGGDIGELREGLLASRQSLQACAAKANQRRWRIIGPGGTEAVGERDDARVELLSGNVSSWRRVGERDEDGDEM